MYHNAIIGLLSLAAALLAAVARSERRERRAVEGELARACAVAAEAVQQGYAEGLTEGYRRARAQIRQERDEDFRRGYDEALADVEEARVVGGE